MTDTLTEPRGVRALQTVATDLAKLLDACLDDERATYVQHDYWSTYTLDCIGFTEVQAVHGSYGITIEATIDPWYGYWELRSIYLET